MGYPDEYDTCSDCRQAVPLQPGWFGFEYWLTEGDILCRDCVWNENQEEYLKSLTDDSTLSVNEMLADPTKHGFVKLDFTFERGLHIDQNDDRATVLKAIDATYKAAEVVFTVRNDPHTQEFWAWIRSYADDKIDLEALVEIFEAGAGKLDYDPATETAKVLRGEHSDYLAIETRKLTAKELF